MSPTENFLHTATTPLSRNQPPRSGRSGPVDRCIAKLATGIGLAAVWLVIGVLLGLGLVSSVLLGVLLLVLFQTLVRRRSPRTLLARDSDSFARRWQGKILVAVILLAIPAAMTLLSVSAGRYVDDSWKALLILVVLAGSYLASHRLVLTVLVAATTVTIVSWAMAPQLSTARNGDPTVLAHLDQQAGTDMLVGLHDLAVAEVNLDASQKVQMAGIGADDTTRMEVGSMTKAMTGLVIADAVRRGEVRMDVPVATYLHQLEGTAAGMVTMGELVTHSAGYAEFGTATLRAAAWRAPLGQDFLTTDQAQMTEETRTQTLTGRGSYAYSTLGAATAGQAVAVAAGMSYPELMRTRLFEPLAMFHTAIQTDDALIAGGQSPTGLPVRPWVMGAYAPGGAAVSTTGDIAKLATALLDGTAPGMPALEPTSDTDQPNSRVGGFWRISTWRTGQTITWHNGQTGGYASYLGLDRPQHKAVIILSDVATDTTPTNLGIALLADRGAPIAQ